jgi:hypothetical protein
MSLITLSLRKWPRTLTRMCVCACVSMHYLLCVHRFPEAEADQKWIYRHAPEEIERPYRVDEGETERLIGELGGSPTYELEAPENGVLKGLAVGDSDGYKTDQVIGAKAAWVAGEVTDHLLQGMLVMPVM